MYNDIDMSSKLTVHRIDDSNNIKYLYITIDEKDNSKCKFGNWVDGKAELKRKDTEKLRFVVKITTGEENTPFNIEQLAKLINVTEDNQKSVLHNYVRNPTSSSKEPDSDRFVESPSNNMFNVNLTKKQTAESINNLLKIKQRNINGDDTSPLEYTLQRVKENNAKILENISLLNKTLNYTKKKEINDLFCSKPLRSYPCETCGKCFVYETGLRRHYLVRHASTDNQPRWQIVWTCAVCFQVWPRKDLATHHSNFCCESEKETPSIREIKTSSLIQCEFCEKVFTSIPRLLNHCKIHSSMKNYECNACKIGFVSYKIAEQHWLLCPWVSICYKFSLPKMLLCSSCDRKFRNYDHLYNHKYKTSHFLSKNKYENDVKCAVYQCELCAKIFEDTEQLETHRSHSHPRYNPIILYNN
ncbi:unnamed protein product [Leptidea sinapis]|uniref:C2H2-type domain-containing protein n=1 Tax=Leptidea sinapis TaxID=189913 RepID=A0A5E4QJD9_9NEOP|nr:unnamed protein product [Leptidea sinapis]